MNLIDLLHQKLELFRLEQRYTRRRNRRSTFVSDAQYVDGEYIYAQNTQNSYSAKCSAGSGSSDSDDAAHESRSPTTSKASRRLSKMASDLKGKAGGSGVVRHGQSRVSVREVKWDNGVRA